MCPIFSWLISIADVKNTFYELCMTYPVRHQLIRNPLTKISKVYFL